MIGLGLLAFAGTTGLRLRAEITIEDIVENVRRNERLYENLDITLRYDYQVADRAPAEFDGGAKEITGIEAMIRFVTQDQMFRLDRTANAIVDGRAQSLDRIRAFDGVKTRLYDQGAIGNIIDGRIEDDNAVRPHTLLIADVIHAPLSTYMSGDQAMSEHPMGGKKWRDRLSMQVSYKGTAARGGLRCHQIWITTSIRGGAEYDRWELWLAEDRNYIPTEMTGWTFNYSRNQPVGSGSISDLREISPGVWFPFNVEVVTYDPAELQRNDRQKVNWRARYVVETASLDPHRDFDYFHNVEFPEGTAVYEVKDQKVARSYREGVPGGPGPPVPAVGRPNQWVLIGNIAIVLGAIVAVWTARRRKRRARDSKRSGLV